MVLQYRKQGAPVAALFFCCRSVLGRSRKVPSAFATASDFVLASDIRCRVGGSRRGGGACQCILQKCARAGARLQGGCRCGSPPAPPPPTAALTMGLSKKGKPCIASSAFLASSAVSNTTQACPRSL